MANNLYAKDIHLDSVFDLSYHEYYDIATEGLSSLLPFRCNSKIGNCSPLYLEVEALSDSASDRMLQLECPYSLDLQGRGCRMSGCDIKWQRDCLSEYPYSLKFVEDWPLDVGYDAATVDSVHSDQKNCDFRIASCISAASSLDPCDFDRTPALKAALVQQPPPAIVLTQPSHFHSSASHVGDDDAEGRKNGCGANREQRSSLPGPTPDWRAALQVGIETLSAIQMVGGGAEHARKGRF